MSEGAGLNPAMGWRLGRAPLGLHEKRLNEAHLPRTSICVVWLCCENTWRSKGGSRWVAVQAGACGMEVSAWQPERGHELLKRTRACRQRKVHDLFCTLGPLWDLHWCPISKARGTIKSCLLKRTMLISPQNNTHRVLAQSLFLLSILCFWKACSLFTCLLKTCLECSHPAPLPCRDIRNNEISWAIEDSISVFEGMKKLNTL